MNIEAYIKYLKEYRNEKWLNMSGDVEDNIAEVSKFIDYLAKKNIINGQDAKRDDITEYIIERREQAGDLYWVLVYLTEFAGYLKNEELRSETMLLHDANNVMNRASELTEKLAGKEVWEKVFGDVEMPKLGWTLSEMAAFSYDFEKRSLQAMPREKYEHICVKNAHSWEPEWDDSWREQFLAAGSVDHFITMREVNQINELIKCRDEGMMFFTQEVDDEVIDYLRNNPQFVRVGNKIHVKRMPFLTKRFLSETDEKMKRYYACHCPLIRSAILEGNNLVSNSFCYCSLGHDKRCFDVAFGQETTGRVIKTAVDEDSFNCIFEIDIPDEIMRDYT